MSLCFFLSLIFKPEYKGIKVSVMALLFLITRIDAAVLKVTTENLENGILYLVAESLIQLP